MTASTTSLTDDLRTKISHRRPGWSLDADFYCSPEMFSADISEIFGKQWIFAATAAEIAEPGDFLTVDIGAYSVIVVRDDDEQIQAYHNVCRHRGTRLLAESHGAVGNIVCGYHQWTYGLDGELRYAEAQPPTFDRSCFSLRSLHVRTVGGLIFLCLAAEAPGDIDEVAELVEPFLAPHRLAEAKVAKQVDVVEDGNWKLVMENNRECYHCGGHPELLNVFFPTWGYSDADSYPPRLHTVFERYREAKAEATMTWQRYGLPYRRIEQLDTRATGFHIEREPMDLAGESFTLDGTAAVSTALADDIPTLRLGRMSMHMQPNMWLHVTADHAVTFSVIPLAADRTLVRTTWLVHADAREGIDYDLDRLTGVWEITNTQDAAFVALAQQGISSPAYRPGPYGPSEFQCEAFCNWYILRLREHLGIPPGEQLPPGDQAHPADVTPLDERATG